MYIFTDNKWLDNFSTFRVFFYEFVASGLIDNKRFIKSSKDASTDFTTSIISNGEIFAFKFLKNLFLQPPTKKPLRTIKAPSGSLLACYLNGTSKLSKFH